MLPVQPVLFCVVVLTLTQDLFRSFSKVLPQVVLVLTLPLRPSDLSQPSAFYMKYVKNKHHLIRVGNTVSGGCVRSYPTFKIIC